MPDTIATEDPQLKSPAVKRAGVRGVLVVRLVGVLREFFFLALLTAPLLALWFGQNRMVTSTIWVFYLATGLCLRRSPIILCTLAGAWFGFVFGTSVTHGIDELPEKTVACVIAGLGLGFLIDQLGSGPRNRTPTPLPKSTPSEPIRK